MATMAPITPQAARTASCRQSAPVCLESGPVSASLNGRTGSQPVTRLSSDEWIGRYVPDRNSSGNSTSCATAGAASAFEITDATATPSAQKLAAPSTSVSAIAGQSDGNGTPYTRPTPTISAMSARLTRTQCASSPTKYAQAGSGVARTRLRTPFCRRAASATASCP